MLRWILVILFLLLPTAVAVESLADFEEPHQGTDKVWDLVVTQDEANARRALVYRNTVGHPFGFIIYDASGAEIFIKNGSRGVQTFPALEAGEYKLFVRGSGEFQVTEKAFERTLTENNISTTLRGTDAYVLSAGRYWQVDFTGDVRIEWWSLTGVPEIVVPPTNRTAEVGQAYVMTVRGDPGAPYTITLNPVDAPVKESPGVGLAVFLVALSALVGLGRLRRTK